MANRLLRWSKIMDDPESSANKKPLFKVEINSHAPLAGLIGLCVMPSQLLRAWETGHLDYSSRYWSYSVEYKDHPWDFMIHLGIQLLSIPLCIALICAYFFKKKSD